MAGRRGTKSNPFEVGERVFIYPVNRNGVVKEVIQAQWRKQIKYRIEYKYGENSITDTFAAVVLGEALEN